MASDTALRRSSDGGLSLRWSGRLSLTTRILAVNIFAPYVLTSLITRPTRLICLSIGMHRDGVTWLRDIDWLERRALAEAERSAL